MAGVVADRVVVELEAKLDRYNANVTQAMRLWERSTSDIRQNAVRTEQQVTKSLGSVKSALLASSSLLAGAFGANALKNLADGYTRFTNQLRVAGLEGQKLANTQNDLFAVAQKGGVPLELLGRLYGGLASLQKDLGTTSKDSLALTEAVSNSIKVQGTSAEAAAGAILGLNQALAQTRVQSDEYNQILDGARPLLQAAADASDKYGGSLAKLKQDIEAGKVSGQDLFRILQGGFTLLSERASKANLTIGQSFTILNNALGKYVGETDAALSITERISAGIIALSNNLQVIVPALAGIAAGYAALKLGPVIFDAAAAATARALSIDQALAAQILAGNASYVSRTAAQLAQATATSAVAAAEVAAMEAEVAARTQAVASSLAEIQAKQTLVAANGADALSRDALTAAVVTNTQANAALIASETALAAAQGRAAVAAEAEAVAVASATAAKRAGTAMSALFAGSLSAIGAALPILAIGALAAAVVYYATTAKDATFDTKAFAQEGQTLAANLAAADAAGNRAASAVANVGNQAATATPKMRAFANATGEAADRLFQLAKARRAELLESLRNDEVRARQQREAAQAREQSNTQSGSSVARFGYLPGAGNPLYGPTAEGAKAGREATEAARRERAAREAQDRVRRTPLTGFLSGSEKEGGRDVEGDYARVTRDLTVARERGIKSQIDSLEAQRFEIAQYKKYRAQGLSPQAAQEASNRDKGDFQAASRGAAGDRSARAGAAAGRKADREAAAAANKQAAVERDVAGDAARYAALTRRADNDIATAKAELAGSAEQRAAIEKARIEDERANREEELRQSFKQGQLGAGAEGQTRLLELQRLNNERAALEVSVVELHERQRIAAEAVDVAKSNNQNERDLLATQVPLLDTNKQRRDAALRLLELQYEQERIELRAITVANGRTATEEAIAKARLAQLDKMQSNDTAATERQFRGPLQEYFDSFKDPAVQVEQAVVDKLKSIDDAITDGIADKIGVKDPFLKKLLQIFIQQNILKPLYEGISGAMGGGGGGGGGILGGILGSILGGGKGGGTPTFGGGNQGQAGGVLSFGASTVGSFFKGIFGGRASGGHVNAGQMYRVTDGEGFMPSQSGKVIPLGRMRGVGGGGTTIHQTIKVDASNSVNPDGYADHIVSRVRQETVSIVGAASRGVTKGVPARLAQYQRDGI